MKKFRSLNFKITFFVGMVILITTFIIAGLVYFSGRSVAMEQAVRSLNDESKIIATQIQSALNKVEDDITILSKTPPIQGIIRSYQNNGIDPSDGSTIENWKNRLAIIFISMLDVNPWYTKMRFIGVHDNGKEIVKVIQTRSEIYRIDDSGLQSVADEGYYKTGIMLTQDSIYFSNINYNKENGRIAYPLTPTIRAIIPIYTVDFPVK